jgi:hypothetical protein
MVLNTEFMSLEDCTEMICLYLEHKYILAWGGIFQTG